MKSSRRKHTYLWGFLSTFVKGYFAGGLLEGHGCDLGLTERLLQLWRVARGGRELMLEGFESGVVTGILKSW